PALTHALWLLVLLRLVAPPLWRVPLPSWPAAGPTTIDAQPIARAPADLPEPRAAAPVSPPPRASLTPPTQPTAPQQVTAASAARLASWPWQQALAVFWLGGAAVCLVTSSRRTLAFRRVLRYARPAPAAWQRTSDRLARRLGLRRGPDVRLVPGAVSPLLWAGLGRPVLLLPAELAGESAAGPRAGAPAPARAPPAPRAPRAR